jgi:hypothetical protein
MLAYLVAALPGVEARRTAAEEAGPGDMSAAALHCTALYCTALEARWASDDAMRCDVMRPSSQAHLVVPILLWRRRRLSVLSPVVVLWLSVTLLWRPAWVSTCPPNVVCLARTEHRSCVAVAGILGGVARRTAAAAAAAAAGAVRRSCYGTAVLDSMTWSWGRSPGPEAEGHNGHEGE